MRCEDELRTDPRTQDAILRRMETLPTLRAVADDELERRYRELIPVVEIGGEVVCTYYVQPEPFRRKLAQASGGSESL